MPFRDRRDPLVRGAFPHGGPWGRDFWGFNGFAQFLANRGYAVLLPNFRGSAGYARWRELLHAFYEPFPIVEHFREVVAVAPAGGEGAP